MNINKKSFLIFLFAFLLAGMYVTAQNPYRWTDELELLKRVDKLPEYRTDSYVEQFSSYDRTWGNDDGFAGTYSFLRKEGDKLVIAEMEGPGVINRIWTPTPTDNMLYFYFDGEKEPGLKIKFSDLFSGKVYPFTKPVCGNEIGGFYCYLPITYKKSCKIVFDGPKLEFIQIQYRNLPEKKVETYTGEFSQQDKDLLAEVNRIWADLSPAVTNYTFGKSAGVQTEEKVFTLSPGEEVSFFEMAEPGRIVGMSIDGGTSFEGLYKDVILSAKWDNEKVEAIYAPVADFFGYAYGKGAMRSILMGKQGTSNYCYLPMPFDKSASMKMIYKKREGIQQSPISVNVKVYYNSNKRNVKEEGKFYSVWRREKTPLGIFHKFAAQKEKGHGLSRILRQPDAEKRRGRDGAFLHGGGRIGNIHIEGKHRTERESRAVHGQRDHRTERRPHAAHGAGRDAAGRGFRPFAEKDVALIAPEQIVAQFRVLAQPLPDGLHTHLSGGDFPLIGEIPPYAQVRLAVGPGKAHGHLLAVLEAQPPRSLHLQEKSVHGVGQPCQFQPLPKRL